MNITLRRITAEDAARVREILSTPEVAAWWGDPDTETAELVAPEDPDTTSYAIEFEGTVVGLIQGSEETTPAYRHAGIDLAVHPDWHGRGIGTAAIHRLATHFIEERGHHRLTIDPAAENARAISVYAKLGFKPVGVLRQYEQRRDGTWRDGLLMELLAGELTKP
ncbi:GNAT family N-acetyltransferase [Saccharothrix sp. AJ9571]|nr:GNAT family N-acetyltransferase [Saccharothrix sp. AJ9571]